MAGKTAAEKKAEREEKARRDAGVASKVSDRVEELKLNIASLEADSVNPELTDGERTAAAESLASATAELEALAGPGPEAKPAAPRVTTTLRFGAPIGGRSKCVVDGRDGPVTVWMEDGLPVESSSEVTDAELRKAGFR